MRNTLLVSASFCALASLAQATDFGIADMTIGMSAGQIIAKYKEFRPQGEYQFTQWKLPDGSTWVANGRTLYNELSHPDDMEHERMEFAFTGLGSGNKLFAIRRDLKIKPSQRPSVEAVYQAAIQKYGNVSYVGNDRKNIWAVWKFNSLDGPAEKLTGQLGCIRGSAFPVGLDAQTVTEGKQLSAVCGLYIELHIEGDETGLATDVDSAIINRLNLVREAELDNSEANRRIEGVRTKNMNNAPPPPKL
ncbi:hypothetical protein [Rhizobium sp. C4]|uniref:hypothetical protein n=1 Tax=Rhizobium sp. C4 TaxID=1349800 RepID=UPI001E4B308D|nr:hypothetical protein [Rhizobium sp. C4]MCD2175363.1 hypothetical protein [Rhizobium sp. C4]